MTDQQVTAPLDEGSVPPGLLEALAKAVVAVLSPPRPVPDDGAEDVADFLTAGEFARRHRPFVQRSGYLLIGHRLTSSVLLGGPAGCHIRSADGSGPTSPLPYLL